MKTCTKCKTDYHEPLSDNFNIKKRTKDGFQSSCKACVKIFHIEHYQKRKQYYLDKAAKHNENYRVRGLQYMVDYLKQNPCIDCGETDPIVLEFDHRGNKSCDVSTLSERSLESIQKEIDKCDVRCANCHRKKTAIQLGWYRDIKL